MVLSIATRNVAEPDPSVCEIVGADCHKSFTSRAVHPATHANIGSSNAPVTISEFFDPACEACRAFHPIVKKIIDAFPGKVRVAVRYTPFHGPSKEAIAILEAARKQGRFVPVLEALLEKQPAWAPHGRPGQSPWEFVSGTGLDIDRAKIDARHPSVTAVIDQDFADVKALGVRQTPTFFVDGQPLQRFSAQGLYDLVKQRVAGL